MRYPSSIARHSVEAIKAIAFSLPWIRKVRLRRGRYKTPDPVENWRTYCEVPWAVLTRALALCDASPDDRTLLEIGPGDFVGVGVHWIRAGGRSYDAVDRFPGPVFSPEALLSYKMIVPNEQELRSVLNLIDYRPVPLDSLTSIATRPYDVIFSHRVMQHINDLRMAFSNMRSLMDRHTLSLHYWDFASCGVSHGYPHEFLDIPDYLYRFVYQSRGYPNRIPLSRVKSLAAEAGLTMAVVDTLSYTADDLESSAKHLSRRDLSTEDLGVREALLRFELP